MAFPQVATFAQSDSGITSVTSHSCTMPSGITVGDVLIAIIAVDQDRTVGIDTGASGSNWTIQQQGFPTNPNNLITGAIITKVAEGSDALTVTSSVSDIVNAYVIRLTGAASVYVSSPFGSAAAADADPPNLDPGVGAKDFLWLVAVAFDAQTVATAAPANFTDLTTNAGDSSGACSISWARRELNASSLNPGAFTSVSQEYVAFTIAVEPLASGLTITSVNTTNTAFSAQTNSAVVGTGLSASVVCTYAGIACTNESASSSTSLKITFPNFFTNNIKLGRNYEFKVVG